MTVTVLASLTWFLLTMEPPQMWEPKLLRDTCHGNSSAMLQIISTISTPFYLDI